MSSSHLGVFNQLLPATCHMCGKRVSDGDTARRLSWRINWIPLDGGGKYRIWTCAVCVEREEPADE